RGQVFPYLHPSENPLLLLRRQAVKPLQSIFKPLLPRRRQTPELRIALKRATLLLWRNPLEPLQPLPGVVPGHRRLVARRLVVLRTIRRRWLAIRFWRPVGRSRRARH